MTLMPLCNKEYSKGNNIRRDGQQYAGESYFRVIIRQWAHGECTNTGTVTEGQTYSGTTMLLNGRMSQNDKLGFKLVFTLT